eukprot:gene10224-7166_t
MAASSNSLTFLAFLPSSSISPRLACIILFCWYAHRSDLSLEQLLIESAQEIRQQCSTLIGCLSLHNINVRSGLGSLVSPSPALGTAKGEEKANSTYWPAIWRCRDDISLLFLLVVARVRPPLGAEQGTPEAWRLASSSEIVEIGGDSGPFALDGVYGSPASTADVYAGHLAAIPRRVAGGLNGTIMAYGQSGSGKSFTLLGNEADPRGTDGVVVWAVRDLFAALEAELVEKPNLATVVFLTIVEIYNDRLRDLLVVSKDGSPPREERLSIREKPQGMYVHHAIRRRVHTAKDCIDAIYDHVDSRRFSASTGLNEHSSRSHCVVTIDVERLFMVMLDPQAPRGGARADDEADEKSESMGTFMDTPPANRTVFSSLHFVDLAGSERVAKTGATGDRMAEGGHINRSLATLTTVVQRLCERSTKPNTFVPFRDSCLTHLLKTALGGNALTVVVVCLTPSRWSVDESRSTLQFATRLRRIKNRVATTEVVDPELRIKELEELVKALAQKVASRTLNWWSAKLQLSRALERAEDLEGRVCALSGGQRAGHTAAAHRALAASVERDVKPGATTKEVAAEREQLFHSFQELDGLCHELERENAAQEATIQQLKAQLRAERHEETVAAVNGMKEKPAGSAEPATATEFEPAGPAAPAPAPVAAQNAADLEARVSQLEMQLLEKDAMRDAIIDTKLKRMQELALYLHSYGAALKERLGEVVAERNTLTNAIHAKKQDVKSLTKQFASPVLLEKLTRAIALLGPDLKDWRLFSARLPSIPAPPPTKRHPHKIRMIRLRRQGASQQRIIGQPPFPVLFFRSPCGHLPAEFSPHEQQQQGGPPSLSPGCLGDRRHNDSGAPTSTPTWGTPPPPSPLSSSNFLLLYRCVLSSVVTAELLFCFLVGGCDPTLLPRAVSFECPCHNMKSRVQQYVAGRHGSYMTQFYRPAARVFPTREARQLAVSRKSVERALVLPLDAGNWSRALEVLGARYARLGRTPEHYQRVIRVMVSRALQDDGAASRTAAGEVGAALDRLRDAAYAGDIPSSGSLFVTLVWAYSAVGLPDEAAEAFLQGERRKGFSAATRREMLQALVPLLCRRGRRDAALEILRVSGADPGQYQEALAEAAALNGRWRDVLPSPVTTVGTGCSTTLSSALRPLSTAALHEMLGSALEERAVEPAVAMWDELYRRRRLPVTGADFHALLDCLGACGDHPALIRWFTAAYLPAEPIEPFAPGNRALGNTGWRDAPGGFYLPPAAQLKPLGLSLTPVALNGAFISFPLTATATAGPLSRLPCEVAEPDRLVRLLDTILQHRDDAVVTGYMMTRVGPALAQLGRFERALALLRGVALLQPDAAAPNSTAERRLQRELVQVVYAIHAALQERQVAETAAVTSLPHLFPLAVRRSLVSPAAPLSDAARLDAVESRPFTSLRPSRDRYLPSRSTSALSEATEAEMKANLLAQRRRTSFSGDAERDPRPAPRGLHDPASGWNYFGRGGEMVFSNSRRTPHPFSGHPKVMRARTNPFRSWRLRENSSAAHKENVIKWNGRSSV